MSASPHRQHQQVKLIVFFQIVVFQHLTKVLAIRWNNALLHPDLAPVRIDGCFTFFDKGRKKQRGFPWVSVFGEFDIEALEYDILEKASEVLKKAEGINLQTISNREKAEVIDALRNKYRLKELLEVLHISKSSYFYQENRIHGPDKYANLRMEIHTAFSTTNGCYGYRRIHAILRRTGIVVSEKVVRRLMKEENLAVRCIKRKKYNSYAGEISPEVGNIINRDFHADAPNVKWLTDITEFSIPSGKIYLSPIIDCFDGLAVSWTIGTSPDAMLVNTMLDEAISLLNENEHPIIHSDRGSHYRWPGWIDRMNEAGLTRSMSKKGCSPDNSACEGFFGRLKNEMFYDRSWKDVSTDDFIQTLDAYMHWYNCDRIKKSLGWMSPLEYRISLGLINSVMEVL